MAAIAGIFAENSENDVVKMLDLIRYRGRGEIAVDRLPGATLGIVRNDTQTHTAGEDKVEDRISDHQYAAAGLINGRPFMERDPFGVAPCTTEGERTAPCVLPRK